MQKLISLHVYVISLTKTTETEINKTTKSIKQKMIYLWALSYQLQQNLGSFLKLACKISISDDFIGFNNELCKQNSENVTKLQRDQVNF